MNGDQITSSSAKKSVLKREYIQLGGYMNNIENYLESQMRELGIDVNEEYLEMYDNISNPKLKLIFSTLHSRLISTFKIMNERLPTGEFEAHFWAEPSRTLIATIEMIEGLRRALKQGQFSFRVEDYYQSLIEKCNTFLSRSGGSLIPPGIEKIILYYTIPIFIPNDILTIPRKETTEAFSLKLIGEGSYAQVYKYKDTYYNRYFVVKRAKKELDTKELQRFEQEYQEMAKLNSPYVVEVYCYHADQNEYVMEYMDYSLYDFIQYNNGKLTSQKRKNIGLQVIKAFTYIHSKEILHRDINPNNILLKEYEDVLVVKVADFGLVKIPDSQLTSLYTEFKGYFNDPSLIVDGFSSYNILHETYALTRLLFYVMTGRTNVDNIKNTHLKIFIEKGLNVDKSQRFQNISELAEFYRLIN